MTLFKSFRVVMLLSVAIFGAGSDATPDKTNCGSMVVATAMPHTFLPSVHLTSSSIQQPDNSAPRPSKNPIPDSFTNLQVFPKDISKPELVGVMKQLSLTFKVRCMYCHAVSDDLTAGGFSSDEKDTKVKARELIRMIQAIRPVDSKPSGVTRRRTPRFLQKTVTVESAPLIAGR